MRSAEKQFSGSAWQSVLHLNRSQLIQPCNILHCIKACSHAEPQHHLDTNAALRCCAAVSQPCIPAGPQQHLDTMVCQCCVLPVICIHTRQTQLKSGNAAVLSAIHQQLWCTKTCSVWCTVDMLFGGRVHVHKVHSILKHSCAVQCSK